MVALLLLRDGSAMNAHARSQMRVPHVDVLGGCRVGAGRKGKNGASGRAPGPRLCVVLPMTVRYRRRTLLARRVAATHEHERIL